jgi:glycosyltransferase involved in cell wall biosynthesis
LWDHPLLPVENNQGSLGAALKGLLFRKLFRRMVRFADVVLVSMQRSVLETFPRFSSKTKVILSNNGYDFQSINAVAKANEGRLESRHHGVLGVCHAGSINMRRGLPLLLSYLNNERKVGIHVRLFGRITKNALSAIEAHNKKNSQKIDYMGYLEYEDSLRMIRDSDVCLCLLDQNILSYRYAYPIKLFEYLALGKVVVATRTYATMEIIDSTNNGFLIDNTLEEIDEVFNEIQQLYKSGGIKRIFDNARQTSGKYNWERINFKLSEELKRHFISRYGLMC